MTQRFTWWQIGLGVILISFTVAAVAFLQRSSFSSDDILIIIEGPQNIESGKEVVFRVGVENGTGAALRDVQLTVDLPPSLRSIDGRQFVIFRWDEIASRGSAKEDLALVGQGEGGREEIIRGRVEYSPEGFSGRFVGSREISLMLAALPVTTILDVPESVVPGQEIQGTLHLIVNEELLFSPLFVELVLPDDITLSESNPVLGNDMRWRIEELETGRDYVFRFRAIVTGVPGEEKQVFMHVQRVGALGEDTFITLTQTTGTLRIGDAPLSVIQRISGTTGDVVSPGETLTVSLAYENVSSIAIEDVTITAFLSGDAFDLSSVRPQSGSFNSRTNTITWSKSRLPSLATLSPNSKGTLEFSVAMRGPIIPRNADEKNLTASLKARITSPQRSLAFGGAAFEDQDTVVLKVASAFSLQTSVANGAVTLTLRNTTNNLGGVQVEGVLPAGAVWKDEFIPSGEALSYSEETRTVFWDVGTLSAGTGSVLPVRSVTFQLDSPTGPFIIEEVKASATDLFTGSFLEDITQPI